MPEPTIAELMQFLAPPAPGAPPLFDIPKGALIGDKPVRGPAEPSDMSFVPADWAARPGSVYVPRGTVVSESNLIPGRTPGDLEAIFAMQDAEQARRLPEKEWGGQMIPNPSPKERAATEGRFNEQYSALGPAPRDMAGNADWWDSHRAIGQQRDVATGDWQRRQAALDDAVLSGRFDDGLARTGPGSQPDINRTLASIRQTFGSSYQPTLNDMAVFLNSENDARRTSIAEQAEARRAAIDQERNRLLELQIRERSDPQSLRVKHAIDFMSANPAASPEQMLQAMDSFDAMMNRFGGGQTPGPGAAPVQQPGGGPAAPVQQPMGPLAAAENRRNVLGPDMTRLLNDVSFAEAVQKGGAHAGINAAMQEALRQDRANTGYMQRSGSMLLNELARRFGQEEVNRFADRSGGMFGLGYLGDFLTGNLNSPENQARNALAHYMGKAHYGSAPPVPGSPGEQRMDPFSPALYAIQGAATLPLAVYGAPRLIPGVGRAVEKVGGSMLGRTGLNMTPLPNITAGQFARAPISSLLGRSAPSVSSSVTAPAEMPWWATNQPVGGAASTVGGGAGGAQSVASPLGGSLFNATSQSTMTFPPPVMGGVGNLGSMTGAGPMGSASMSSGGIGSLLDLPLRATTPANPMPAFSQVFTNAAEKARLQKLMEWFGRRPAGGTPSLFD